LVLTPTVPRDVVMLETGLEAEEEDDDTAVEEEVVAPVP